jgi:tetratricopeptide (TPR) repeat protein
MARPTTRRRASFLLAVSLLCAGAPGIVGCGGATVAPESAARRARALPARVTAESFAENRRAYDELEASEPSREVLRDRLIAYLAELAAPLMEANDYDGVVENFAQMTALYTSVELERGPLFRGLAPSAEWLLSRGSPRGDEARVLAAHFVLARTGADAAAHTQAYDELVAWGRDARAHLPGTTERLDGLVHVWEELAHLAPAPPVLDRLAQLYLERRDVFARLLSPAGERPFAPGMSLEDYRMANIAVARAPLDLAAIFLAVGDLTSAEARVRAMGGVAPSEEQVAGVLREARAEDREGDEALLVLARGYMEEDVGRPDVSRALCTLGRRRSPDEARFPQCLARIAAIDERYADATAHYADAIRLAPTERGLYDEALSVLNDLIARGYFQGASRDARALAHQAEQILEERMRRFPTPPPPVPAEQLFLAIGSSEMGAGEATDARRHLERSLQARETTDALLQLALLLERTGEPALAAVKYRRALDLVPANPGAGGGQRAEILEQLGDSLRSSGNAAQAERMYTECLAAWDRAGEGTTEESRAAVALRRGVVLDRLARHAEALVAFRRAMDAGAGQLEIYAKLLAHLAGSEEPDLPFATEVFREAQRQLTLPAEWKVYFALWVKLLATRAHAAPDPELDIALTALVAAPGWAGRLASFGAGRLTYDALLASASTRGEQTEAHFYEGARLLAAGDDAGARAAFTRVMSENMVSFYEFELAQELLGRPATTATAASPAP